MSPRPLLIVIALAAPGLGLAQVSSGTASFSNITFTGTDLDPADAYAPLAFDMGDLQFSYRYYDASMGAYVTAVTQNAAWPYAVTTVQDGGAVDAVRNDGAGRIELTSTATGSGAQANASFSIENSDSAPLVVNPHTRYTLSFGYRLVAAPSGYGESEARVLDSALMVLERPGLPSQGMSFMRGGNEQGQFQLVITNDSDIAGTLIVRFDGSAFANAGVVPEPATLALWLLGLAVVTATARRSPLRQP